MRRAAISSPVGAALVLGLVLAGASPAQAAGGAAAAEEDWQRAFAAARAKGALVLVDVWAPW